MLLLLFQQWDSLESLLQIPMYGHMHECRCSIVACVLVHMNFLEGETADFNIEPFRSTALKSSTAAGRRLAVPAQQLEQLREYDAVSK